MASIAVSGSPFTGNSTGYKTFAVYIASSGSATLYALAGNDPDVSARWIAVPDAAYTASTVATHHCDLGLLYKWVLTGDAVVAFAG